jgi:hypothetical protein
VNITFDPNDQEAVAKAVEAVIEQADLKGIQIAEYDHDAEGLLILKVTYDGREARD